MLENKSILVEQRDGRLTLTLNRPEVSNALSPEMVEDMMSILSNLTEVNLCIIKGAGKNFCSGFDLSDLDDLSDGDLLWRFLRIEALLQMIHYASFPIVVCSQGYTIGAGADLFAACWYRIAAPDSVFKMPGWNFELALGTRRLTRLIGTDKARDMLIDARSVKSGEARTIGLASEVVEPVDLDKKLSNLETRCNKLSAFSKERLLKITTTDTRDSDITAIVSTAGRPGLKERIQIFRASS